MEWVWVKFPNEGDVEDVVSFKDLCFKESSNQPPDVGDEVIVNWKDEKSKKVNQVPAVIVRFAEDKKKLIDLFNGNDCISPSQMGKLKRKRRLPERMCSSSDEEDVQIEKETFAKKLKLQAKKKVRQSENETLSKILEERVQNSTANLEEERLRFKMISLEKENRRLKEENKRLKEEHNTLEVLTSVVSDLKRIRDTNCVSTLGSVVSPYPQNIYTTPARQRFSTAASPNSENCTNDTPVTPLSSQNHQESRPTSGAGTPVSPNSQEICPNAARPVNSIGSGDAQLDMVNIGPGLTITKKAYSKLDFKTMNGLVCSTLDATLTREFMASRSLKGQKPNSMSDVSKLKPGLCTDLVNTLIDFVLKSKIKDKKGREVVASSIKECIRQKLANEAKSLKKCSKNE